MADSPQRRCAMLAMQLCDRGSRDARVLDTTAHVPRKVFVHEDAAAHA